MVWALVAAMEYVLAAPAAAIEIEGIWNAALDQPQINTVVKPTPAFPPLVGHVDTFGFPFETINIQAFYDTGASGILLSQTTADAFALLRDVSGGQNVVFSDVGVGGSADFHVSRGYYFELAPFGTNADIDNPATASTVYTQPVSGAVRVQIGPLDNPDSTLDVFGMPAMAGKVVVMDPTPLDTFLSGMKTYPYDPGTPFNPANVANDPGIPSTDFHIRLSYASFDRFTETTPPGAAPPTLRYNPFIGPNPVLQLDPNPLPDDTPGVTIGYNGLETTGSWLFDTGAATSILSTIEAAKLGVTYPDPQVPVLAGVPLEDQFTLTIGGIGGQATKAGFFLDSLMVETTDVNPNNSSDPQVLKYLRAPVLVSDISVLDPITNDFLTLDGIFGMNLLVATLFFSESPSAFGPGSVGAYEWLVFDEPAGVLGLKVKNELVPIFTDGEAIIHLPSLTMPEPGTGMVLVAILAVSGLWRRS